MALAGVEILRAPKINACDRCDGWREWIFTGTDTVNTSPPTYLPVMNSSLLFLFSDENFGKFVQAVAFHEANRFCSSYSFIKTKL